ncbi:MAG TPA: hypothetical protein VKA45_08780, partial [Gaiellaceae bacterium]|nr:hypothetical protein [Gaiellaceae bacterium]
PRAELAWLQADEQVVSCGLGVPLTRFGAEGTRGYPADDGSLGEAIGRADRWEKVAGRARGCG